MEQDKLSNVYQVSDVVVARVIEGELIIVPLIAGIGDLEDELFTLNETGKAIWNKLDGKKDLLNVVEELASEYDVPKSQIEHDVLGFVEELNRRKILTSVD